MEGKIFSKFNLYDQIGYLLVGIICILIIIFNIYLIGKLQLLPQFNAQSLIVYFIISYFLVHIIQAISNFKIISKYIIKEDKAVFMDFERLILEEAQKEAKKSEQGLSERDQLKELKQKIRFD